MKDGKYEVGDVVVNEYGNYGSKKIHKVLRTTATQAILNDSASHPTRLRIDNVKNQTAIGESNSFTRSKYRLASQDDIQDAKLQEMKSFIHRTGDKENINLMTDEQILKLYTFIKELFK